MSNFLLELKQTVDYPRCRIYRQFVNTMIKDRNIRVNGEAGLFFFVILCSFASFHSCSRTIDNTNYHLQTGEWVCRYLEIKEWFRCVYKHQVLSILNGLAEKHLIKYSYNARKKIIKFKILGWRKYNFISEYDAECQKDTDFFFIPVSAVNELINSSRCSEGDIILDLWMNAIYNDDQVEGSEVGPIVHMRSFTGSPLLSYSDLGFRWGVQNAQVSRVLNKLMRMNYISVLSTPKSALFVIYLKNYLLSMFQISDVMIDKEEISMALNVRLSAPGKNTVFKAAGSNTIESIFVSRRLSAIPKRLSEVIVKKVAEILCTQGIPCCACNKVKYELSPIPFLQKGIKFQPLTPSKRRKPERFILAIFCGNEKRVFKFELTLREEDSHGDFS